jgi:hypothetical protein
VRPQTSRRLRRKSWADVVHNRGTIGCRRAVIVFEILRCIECAGGNSAATVLARVRRGEKLRRQSQADTIGQYLTPQLLPRQRQWSATLTGVGGGGLCDCNVVFASSASAGAASGVGLRASAGRMPFSERAALVGNICFVLADRCEYATTYGADCVFCCVCDVKYSLLGYTEYGLIVTQNFAGCCNRRAR